MNQLLNTAVLCVAVVCLPLCTGCDQGPRDRPAREKPEEITHGVAPPAAEPDATLPPEADREADETEPAEPPEAGAEETFEWTPPRFGESQEERYEMVRKQIAARRSAPPIKDKRVLAAMRHVPRHMFVPPALQSAAYADRPLPIGLGQTISQPYIVALMTEMLELKKGERVLEIGTGSGYQAAVLSEITPHVYTIEILRQLAVEAAERLEKLGYLPVKAKHGDGYYGWEEHAPFDGIIVTCAAGHIPPPLIEQLKPGGRMVIPVGGPYAVQRLMVVTKDEQGEVRTHDAIPVRFVPMTGEMQKE